MVKGNLSVIRLEAVSFENFYIFDSTTISLFTGKTVLVSVYAPGGQNFTGFMEDIDLFPQIKALSQL